MKTALWVAALVLCRVAPASAQAMATCGDKDGDGENTDPISDNDCGAGFIYNAENSASACAGTECSTMVPADKAACCIAQATCGDADGVGALTAGVTDANCGAGYVRNTAAAIDAARCKGASCDVANVAEDKAACCVRLATCGDKDGAKKADVTVATEGALTDGGQTSVTLASAIELVYGVTVTGDGIASGTTVANAGTTTSSTLTLSTNVESGGIAASTTLTFKHIFPITDAECAAVGPTMTYDVTNAAATSCAGLECDIVNVLADRYACCTPNLATCGDSNGLGSGGFAVLNSNCPEGQAYDPSTASVALTVTDASNVGTLSEEQRGALQGACCKDRATCDNVNGADEDTTTIAVSDMDCGEGFVYNPLKADNMCESVMCDVVNNTADHATCCANVGSCGHRDATSASESRAVSDADCGEGYKYNTGAYDSGCVGRVCDMSIAADKATCCLSVTLPSPQSVVIVASVRLTGTTADVFNMAAHKASFANAVETTIGSGATVRKVDVFDVTALGRMRARRRLLALTEVDVEFQLEVVVAATSTSQASFDAAATKLHTVVHDETLLAEISTNTGLTIGLDKTMFVKPSSFGVTCTGLFEQDVAFLKFTADCTGALTIGSQCVLTAEEGYTGGAAECGADGTYTTMPGKDTNWSFIYLLFIVALAMTVAFMIMHMRRSKRVR